MSRIRNRETIIAGDFSERRESNSRWPSALDGWPSKGSYGEAPDDLRLKKLLKKAVEKHTAPQDLIDSIRQGIRR